MNRTIITVIGKDRVGIIARICTYLAENDINVLDINQSIVQGFFNMIMIVDAQNAKKDFAVLNGEIEKISEELGIKIKMQHEDIFNVMHRI
jgi:ACT domain-containing protein